MGCFVCSAFQSKRPVIGYSIIMIVLVLGKFVCLFLTFKTQGLIENRLTVISLSEPNYHISELYYGDENFRKHWDILQDRMRCCGAITFEDFYENATSDCFPSTCNIDKRHNNNATCVKKV